jgi:hypothetical protein
MTKTAATKTTTVTRPYSENQTKSNHAELAALLDRAGTHAQEPRLSALSAAGARAAPCARTNARCALRVENRASDLRRWQDGAATARASHNVRRLADRPAGIKPR